MVKQWASQPNNNIYVYNMINLGYHFFTAYNRAHSSNPNWYQHFCIQQEKADCGQLGEKRKKKKVNSKKH